MDWWDSKRLDIESPSHNNNGSDKRAVDIICTPCQHFGGRMPWDNFKSLWASWVVEEILDPADTHTRLPVRVYFAGDTGYRTVLDGQDEDKVPVCPAFQEIGKTFGGFDLALLPMRLHVPRKLCTPR